MLYEAVKELFEESGIALAEKFIPYYTASIACHIANLKNQEQEFIVQQGRVANLRMHIFMAAPPGYMKCVSKDTLVQLSDGKVKKIDDIEVGDKVLSLNDEYKLEETMVLAKEYTEKEKVIKIKTRSGRTIEVSDSHPFMQLDGWTESGNLEVGDKVAVPRKIPVDGIKEVTEEKARLLGYILSEGGLTTRTPVFTNGDGEVVADFRRCLNKEYPELCMKKKSDDYSYSISGTKGKKNRFTQWLKDLGMMGKKSIDKKVPDDVFTWKNEYIREFLKAYGTGDGCCNDKVAFITSSSDAMLDGIQTLLLRLGINSTIDKNQHQVRMSGEQRWKYISEVGFVGYKDKDYCVKEFNTNYDTVPREIWNMCSPVSWNSLSDDIEYGGIRRGQSKRPNPSRDVVLRAGHYLNNDELINLGTSDILWDEIVDIEVKDEKEELVDIQVSDSYNFIANNFVVHNSLLLDKFLGYQHSVLWKTDLMHGYEGFMCLPAGEQVSMNDGSYKSVETINIGDKVVSFDDENWEVNVGEVVDTFKMEGEVIKIHLRSGRTIRVTNNHPLWTVDGWVEAGQLKEDDYVGTLRKAKSGHNKYNIDKIRLLGFMLAEGNFDEMTFACSDDEVLKKVKQCTDRLGLTVNLTSHEPKIEYRITDEGSGKPNSLKEFFKDCGLYGKTYDKKFIPEFVYTLDENLIREFLKFFAYGDGTISDEVFALYNTSEDIIQGCSKLLNKIGIHGRYWKIEKEQERDIWRLLVTNKNFINKFTEENLSTTCEKIDVIPSSVWDKIDDVWNDSMAELSRKSNWCVQQSKYNNYNIPYSKYQMLDCYQDIPRYDNVFWDKIVKIEKEGTMDVYNLTVEDDNTFCVNDVITHNTEAGYVGTIKSTKSGNKKKEYGAAHEYKKGILGIDEFEVISNMLETDYGKSLDTQLLTSLDQGFLTKRLADGKIQYETQLTLWTGSQPMRFDLSSGLGRRLFFIYFIPTKEEEEKITKARRIETEIPDMKVFERMQGEIELLEANIDILEDVSYDKEFYDFLEKYNVPHYEEIPYERFALGYTLATTDIVNPKLKITLNKELKEHMLNEIKWRRQIKRGPQISQVEQLLKDNGAMLLSNLKDKLTDFGLTYEQASQTLNTMLKNDMIEYKNAKSSLPGKGKKLVRLT